MLIDYIYTRIVILSQCALFCSQGIRLSAEDVSYWRRRANTRCHTYINAHIHKRSAQKDLPANLSILVQESGPELFAKGISFVASWERLLGFRHVKEFA